MDVSRTTWTILAVFTLGAYFFVIIANQIADDPPKFHVPGGDENASVFDPHLSPHEEVRLVFDNGLEPPSWTRGIEGVMYAWQAFIIVYSFTLLCRRSGAEDDDYLYCSPQFWNPWFFVCYIFAFLFDIGYVISFGLKRSEFSFLFVALCCGAISLAVFFSVVNLNRTQAELLKRGFFRDVVFNIAVVQNGIVFYGMWRAAMFFEHFNILLIDKAGLTDNTATTISFALFLVDIIIWFALDNFVFTKSLRYIFTAYVVTIWYLLGVLISHWDMAFGNSIFGLVVLCLTIVTLVTKIVLVINCSRDEPMLSEGYQRI